MVKRLFPILLALLLLPAFALADEQVIDRANLFSPGQIAQMQAIIERIEEEHQVDMVVLSTNDVPDDYSESMRRVRDYADDYYDNGGYGMGPDNSGMLILLDMNNRVMWLSTAGVMIDYITDSREEDILDTAYAYLTRGQYGDSIIAALNQVERQMARGREEGSFRYDEVTGERLSGVYNALTTGEMMFAAVAAIAVAAVIVLCVKGSYSLSGSTYSYDQAANTSVVLTRDNETFLRETVHRRPRNTGSSSSGGSSGSSGGSGVHRSSGGVSHGGGGRRF